MAVPKRKTSRSKKRSRMANWKAKEPTVSECPHCHQPKLPHHICPECGYYNGREVEETS